MNRSWLLRGLGGLLVVALAGLGGRWLNAGESFDKLSDADRKEFTQRFVKDIWPLLQRNGKNGCVGCHSGKLVSALRLSGNAEKDFHKLLKDGFFLHGDAGSLLGRITDKDPQRRMPPEKRTPWTAAEIKLLHDFSKDIDSKQRKK